MPLPHTLDTARLHLRPPTMADCPRMLERWLSDLENVRYLSFPLYGPDELDRVQAFIHSYLASQGQEDAGHIWVLNEAHAPNEPIGMLGVGEQSGIYSASVGLGYTLARPFWGKGYVSEAVQTLLPHLFALPTLHRLWAVVHPDNAASERVLQKTGMSYEGRMRASTPFPNCTWPKPCPEPQDAHLWAMTRSDFQKQQH